MSAASPLPLIEGAETEAKSGKPLLIEFPGGVKVGKRVIEISFGAKTRSAPAYFRIYAISPQVAISPAEAESFEPYWDRPRTISELAAEYRQRVIGPVDDDPDADSDPE